MADRTVTLRLDEVLRIYHLLVDLQQFFHQRMHYSQVDEYATRTYPELHDVVYNVIQDWIPADVMARIEEPDDDEP